MSDKMEELKSKELEIDKEIASLIDELCCIAQREIDRKKEVKNAEKLKIRQNKIGILESLSGCGVKVDILQELSSKALSSIIEHLESGKADTLSSAYNIYLEIKEKEDAKAREQALFDELKELKDAILRAKETPVFDLEALKEENRITGERLRKEREEKQELEYQRWQEERHRRFQEEEKRKEEELEAKRRKAEEERERRKKSVAEAEQRRKCFQCANFDVCGLRGIVVGCGAFVSKRK